MMGLHPMNSIYTPLSNPILTMSLKMLISVTTTIIMDIVRNTDRLYHNVNQVEIHGKVLYFFTIENLRFTLVSASETQSLQTLTQFSLSRLETSSTEDESHRWSWNSIKSLRMSFRTSSIAYLFTSVSFKG